MKLLDPSGANAWWWRRRDFSPPRGGTRLVLRRASLDFASGPRSGGDPDRVGAVELAVAQLASRIVAIYSEPVAVRVEPVKPAVSGKKPAPPKK